ncbi:hypothetical protein BUALT_Bualt05G0076500 [Buddleja alternifolia]|uniref:Secreted protein n=1 Tax=Buddleja alternifolia TaxID=168488 RepID=A0AAV6XLR2_9LAMI|nr:hypothetical protein BUALT_Bualt05G0076500 [Buddleja alternifolia]
MGLAMVALAKLSLIGAASSSHGVSPMVTSLLCPFVLKLSFSFRPLNKACKDMVYGLRLFFFQMWQITFDTQPTPGSGGSSSVRWQRALRLVYESTIQARHAQSTPSAEENLVALSMLAL